MAKRRSKKERDTSKLKPAPKATKLKGGTEVQTRGAGTFLNMEEGDEFFGVLMGTTTVKNDRDEDRERFVAISDEDKAPYILPDHYELNDKLKQVLEGGEMRKVYILFRGFELNVPGVAGGKLARYYVEGGEVKAS